MKRNLLLVLLAIILVGSLALVACDQTDNDGWGTVFTYETAYAEAQELGYTGTLQDFIDSIKGKDGANGIDGKDGVGIKSVLVNEQGKLVVTLTNDIVIDCGTVQGPQGETGPQGPQGNPGKDSEDGADGITPQIKIGEDNYWYISYDNGATWASLGVKATGADGEQGPAGENGINGTTPQLRIGEDNYWYVSYDNGTTWTSLGVKATGSNGAQGTPGKGIASILKTNTDGFVDTYTITYTDGTTTTFTVTNGKDGQNGEQGIQGIQGVPGIDGHTPVITIQSGYWYIDGVNTNVLAQGVQGDRGEQGPQGNQGVSIVNTAFDEDGNTVITYSDGTTQVIEHTWEKLYSLTKADCQTEGKELYSCVDCNLVRVVTVAKTEHNYIQTVFAPTCTSQGYTLHTCSICDDSYTDSFVETNGSHDFQQSNTCAYCEADISAIAVEVYNMSATTDDNVKAYVVARMDGTHDAYIKGTGAMRDGSPFYVDDYNISNAYIENGVTSIGSSLFDSANIASIFIPDSVTRIESHAFVNCNYLSSIIIEGSLEIGSNAFLGTAYFNNSDNWQNKVLYIGNCLIAAKSTIETCGVKQGTTVIADRAFSYCTSLTNIELPNSLLIMGDEAFEGCSRLNNVIIPERVNAIGERTFSDCISLTELTLASGIVAIGEYAFYNCTGLTEITIPSSVTAIGAMAFEGCSSLVSVTFEKPSYWYIGNAGATSGKVLDLSDISQNATYLTAKYSSNHWYYTDTIEQNPDSSNPEDTQDSTGTNGVTPQLKIDTDNYWYISYDNGATWTSLGVQATGANGTDGVGIKSVEVNEEGKLIITLTDDTIIDCGNVKGEQGTVGPQGPQGEDGNGISSIDKTSTEGLVDTYTITFTDGTTTTFTVTNGKDGQNGEQGIQGVPGVDGHTPVITIQGGYWYIDGINTNVLAEGIKGDVGPQGPQGNPGKDGEDGITPQLKIGADNYWYVSYDNGATWTSLGVKATGTNGTDGVGIKSVAVNEEGKLIITLTDDTVIDCGNVKGEQSTVGPQGPQGVSIVSTAFDENGNTVITYSDGTTQTIEHTWQKFHSLTMADCQTDGKDLYFCSDCGLVRLVVVDKTGHSYEETIVESTCTSQGYTLHTCSVCGDNYKDNYVETNGVHYFQEADTCVYCAETIKNVAVDSYNMSATTEDNVRGYVVPRADGLYDAYINGTGAMKDYTSSNTPFYVDGYSIKNAYIGNGVTSIGSSAFYGCSSLINITIPDSVTSIGYDAFYNCSSFTSVTIGNSVTSIGSGAFHYCSRLTNVYITDIASWCSISFSNYFANPFYYADNLYVDNQLVTELVIPDGVTSIGSYAFDGCGSLTSITIPDSVTSIGSSAFYNCSSLTSITIPNSVTSIGYSAFYNCSSLTSITIPDSVTSIGREAFCNTEYYNNTDNWQNKVLYIDNCLIEAKITIEECVVKEGTTIIANNAFFECSSLTSITIPDSVTSIGSYAFCGCISFTSITIPDSVTSIGEYAFRACSSLTSITIPFVGATLNGTSNTHFGYIFGASRSFDNSSYVPSSLKSVVITGGSSIGSYAFEGCSSLTSITIPDSVTSIGSSAFSSCSSLTSITIPDSVTSIGSSAFYACYKLVEVVNKSSSITVTKGSSANGYVGYYALAVYNPGDTYETHLSNDHGYIVYTDGQEKILVSYAGVETELILPSYITKINGDAFYGCSSLTSITIPDSVTSIGNSAFEYCSTLTSITIPDSVTSIGSSAFRYCSSLTNITIPDSVTSIGEYAFSNCSRLSSVTFERNCWYVARTEGATSGTFLDLSDASQNVTYLNSTYRNYYWYASEHSYTAVVVAPTCTEKGYTSHTCDHCGDNYVDAEIKALGHNYIAVKTPQTETTPAFTTFTCETCGYSYSVEEDAVISPVENVVILTNYGFFHNPTTNSYYEHQGLDFAAEVGTEVYAIYSGTVNNIYKADIMHGTEVIISCDNGYTLVYRFVEEVPGLEAGQTVTKGQVIATVAEATGDEYKLGSHLHFEIIVDGKTIDPTTVLNIEEK